MNQETVTPIKKAVKEKSFLQVTKRKETARNQAAEIPDRNIEER